MGMKRMRGFTIIETMLFLSVSALLAVGVLAGSGVMIGQERYKASVNSVKSLLQQQFSEAASGRNSRTGQESCTNNAVAVPPVVVSAPDPRGTSNCLLMGRYVAIDGAGVQITTADVIGYRTSSSAPVESTDYSELTTNYRLALSPIGSETTTVDWDAKIVAPGSSTAQPLTMVIVRSPISSMMMSFASNTVQPDINTLVAGGVGYPAVNLCVQGSEGLFVGGIRAVRINTGATNASAIEIPSESERICS